jgi:hypothetical protein
LIVLACVAVSLVVLHGAQGTTTPKGTGVILGWVLDAASGRGIPDAIVTLNARVMMAAPGAAAEGPPKLITEAEGRFVFHDVPAGPVQMTVVAPGYVNGSIGQARPGGSSRPLQLADGERVGDLTIRLWKYAVMSGTVVDEAGEPAVGVSVQAMRRTMQAGHARFSQVGSGTTDDRGQYRIASLTPGDFIAMVPEVQVTMPASVMEGMMQALVSGTPAGGGILDLMSSGGAMPTGTGVRVGDSILQSQGGGRSVSGPAPTPDGRFWVYTTLFHPSAGLSAQAAAITLASGEEKQGIDFQLRLSPTVRVTGSVAGPSGPVGGIAVRLVPVGADDSSDDSGLTTATASTKPDGTFTMLAVPVGQYTAKVLKQPRPQIPAEVLASPLGQLAFAALGGGPPSPQDSMLLFAQMPVAIGEKDVDGLAITLREGSKLSGHLEFDGASPKPPLPGNYGVTLTPASGASVASAPFSSAPKVDADGRFTTQAYPPGRYYVTFSGGVAKWSIKSITAGGRDVTNDAIEIKDTDVGDVVMTFTDQSAQVTGTVHVAGTSTVPPATVLVIPTDYHAWIAGGMSARRSRTIVVAKAGTYSSTLPAGDYLIAALEDADVGDMQDPAFVETLVRVATKVTIADGETHALDLQIVKVPR